jgi:hypothetical protein
MGKRFLRLVVLIPLLGCNAILDNDPNLHLQSLDAGPSSPPAPDATLSDASVGGGAPGDSRADATLPPLRDASNDVDGTTHPDADSDVARPNDAASLGDSSDDGAHRDGAIVDAAYCDGGAACNGQCVDTSIDRNNCGSCGRSCRGGACLGARCSPVIVASGIASPEAIALDDTFVYWGDGKEIHRTLKSGIGTIEVVSAGQARVVAMGIGNGYVYWSDATSIFKAPVTGGTAEPFVATTVVQGILPFGSDVYFIQNVLEAGVVTRASVIDGGTFDIRTGQNNPIALTTNGARIFVSNDESGGTIYGFDPNGQNLGLLSSADFAHGLAADQTDLYFSEAFVGRISRVSIAGGAAQPLTPSSSPKYAQGLAIDATHVFFTIRGSVNAKASDGGTAGFIDGEVWMMDKDGGARTLLAGPQYDPYGIVTDDEAVYWVNAGFLNAGTSSNGQLVIMVK